MQPPGVQRSLQFRNEIRRKHTLRRDCRQFARLIPQFNIGASLGITSMVPGETVPSAPLVIFW